MITKRERFNKNMSMHASDDHNYTGRARFEKGYQLPTHKQMDKFDKHGIPHDIDPDMRDLVINMNDSGFTTVGCCQHTGFVNVAPHKAEVPKSVPKSDLSMILGGQFSARKVDAESRREIAQLHKEEGFKVTSYEPPAWKRNKAGISFTHTFNSVYR